MPGLSFVVDSAILRECEILLSSRKFLGTSRYLALKQWKYLFWTEKAGEVLFTGPSAVVGSVNTGVWAVANMVFILRDGDSMKQITKFTEAPRAAIDSLNWVVGLPARNRADRRIGTGGECRSPPARVG